MSLIKILKPTTIPGLVYSVNYHQHGVLSLLLPTLHQLLFSCANDMLPIPSSWVQVHSRLRGFFLPPTFCLSKLFGLTPHVLSEMTTEKITENKQEDWDNRDSPNSLYPIIHTEMLEEIHLLFPKSTGIAKLKRETLGCKKSILIWMGSQRLML